MNKELIIEALEALKTQVENYMDANDAHLSTFYVTKCNEISEEIDRLDSQNKYDS